MPRRYLSISIISITRYYVIHIYQDIHSLILGGVIYYHSPGFTPMYPQSYMVHCSRHLYNCWWGLSLTGHAVCRYINMDSIMATKNVVFNSRCPYSCCVFQSLQVKAVSICISFSEFTDYDPMCLKSFFSFEFSASMYQLYYTLSRRLWGAPVSALAMSSTKSKSARSNTSFWVSTRLSWVDGEA